MEPKVRAIGSIGMEYRGVEYTITHGTQPDVWRWRVMAGKPEMLRMGEAAISSYWPMGPRACTARGIEPNPEAKREARRYWFEAHDAAKTALATPRAFGRRALM